MQPYKSEKVGGGIGCKNFCQVAAEPLMKKLQGFIKVGFNLIAVTLPSRSFTMHLVSPTIRRISLEKKRLANLNSGSLLMVSRTYAVSLGFKNLGVMSTPLYCWCESGEWRLLFEKDRAKLGVELFELLWSGPIHQNGGGNYFLRICDPRIDARIKSEFTLLGDEFLTFDGTNEFYIE